MIALLFGVAYAWNPLPQGSWAWQDEPIEDGFRISASFDGATGGGPGWDAAIRAAARAWNEESEAAVVVRIAGPDPAMTTSQDFEGLLVWDPGSAGGTVLAYAEVWDGPPGIVECDIVFLGTFSLGSINWSVDPAGADPDEWDAARVAMHEFGHCLGLGHTNATGAIMRPVVPGGTGPEDLVPAADDDEGLVSLYGARSGPMLVIDAVVVDDGADGVLSSDEAATLLVTVVNVGTATADGVQVDLAVIDGAVVPTTATEELGALLPGDAVTSSTLAVDVSTCGTNHVATLELALTDDAGHAWPGPVTLPVTCIPGAPADLVASLGAIDDDQVGPSDGNGNGVAELGEYVELEVEVTNVGAGDAAGVTFDATSGDPALALISSSLSWSAVPAAAVVTGTLRARVGPTCPAGDAVTVDVDLADGSGGEWPGAFDVPMTCAQAAEPHLAVAEWSVLPAATVGTASEVWVTVRNDGDGPATGASVELRRVSGDVVVSGEIDLGDVEAAAEVEAGPFSLEVDGDCGSDQVAGLQARFATDAGYVFLAGFDVPVTCEAPPDTGDPGDTGDTGDTSDTADTADTSDTSDTGDTADTGDPHDTGDTSDTSDTGDTGDVDTGDTSDTDDTSEVDDTDPGDPDTGDDPPCGCATPGGPSLGWLVVALLTVRGRSRPRRAASPGTSRMPRDR